jgi:hypothetical protein
MSVLPPPESFDYILPLPYTSNVELNDAGEIETHLSIASTICLDAAINLWKDNRTAKLLMTGESGYGDDLPDTASLMLSMAVGAGVPSRAVVTLHTAADGITPLNNTCQQLTAACRYINGLPTVVAKPNVAAVALDFHRWRVARTLRQVGLGSTVLTAESILSERQIAAYDAYLPHLHKLGRAELPLKFMSFCDPKSQLINWYTGVRGSRLADIAIDEAGSVQVHRGTARRRLSQVLDTIK